MQLNLYLTLVLLHTLVIKISCSHMYHNMYTTEYIRVYVCTYACMQIVELQNQVAAWIGANDCQELSMTIMFPV